MADGARPRRFEQMAFSHFAIELERVASSKTDLQDEE
tara:strand:+ start:698 stop:808 length:111 start_codon:yes stop_codon:yes gene_type:complete